MMIKDRIKDLRRVRAGDLKPNPRNWRTHPKAQADALRGVLAEIGYADALIARELDDGSLELIDGHLRAETTPDHSVPVLVLDVTEAEAGKLLAVLDPLVGMAETNKEKLAALLAEVSTTSEGLGRMLDGLAQRVGAGIKAGMVDPDQIPSPAGPAVTRHGDIWILGEHRVMCGDSGSVEDLDVLLAGSPVHLVNTDPPYNVKVEPRSNNAIAAGLSSFTAPVPASTGKHHQKFDVNRHPSKAKGTHRTLRAKDRPLANDFVTDEHFEKLLMAWFGNIARVLVPGGGFYIWGGYANCANYPPALKACGLYFSQSVIWDKQHPVLTRKDFMGAHEWCFYGWREGAAHKFYGPANVPDLWPIKKVSPQSMVHLTEKPVELAARAIQYSSQQGENVLDLFGGSGSTLIACEQTGRKAYLMELDGPYADVIVRRWEQFTGKTALLTGTEGPHTFAEVAKDRGVDLSEGQEDCTEGADDAGNGVAAGASTAEGVG